VPGATRDFVIAVVELDGLSCELVDVAGEDSDAAASGIAHAAQQQAASQRRAADLRLECRSLATPEQHLSRRDGSAGDAIVVATMSDRAPGPAADAAVLCSSVTGEGVEALAREIRRRLVVKIGEGGARSVTAARSTASLREANRALAAAVELLDSTGDELLAAEIRSALHAVGEVTGAVCADDVLDRVFSQFCIGK
jgi:tRNA modification GTPase